MLGTIHLMSIGGEKDLPRDAGVGVLTLMHSDVYVECTFKTCYDGYSFKWLFFKYKKGIRQCMEGKYINGKCSIVCGPSYYIMQKNEKIVNMIYLWTS